MSPWEGDRDGNVLIAISVFQKLHERYGRFGFGLCGCVPTFFPAGVAVAIRSAGKLVMFPQQSKLSVTGNCIDPLSLDVKNSAPYEITVQATARVIANGTDIAETMVEEPSQIIEKSRSKSFSIRPLAVSESGRQQVAAARSKAITSGKDYLDAVLSVKAVVKTWLYAEIQISRDFPLRIHLTN